MYQRLPVEIVGVISSFLGHDLNIPFKLEFYRKNIDKLPRIFLASNSGLPLNFRRELCLPLDCTSRDVDSHDITMKQFNVVDWKPINLDVKRAHLPFFCDFVPESIVTYIIQNAEPSRIPWYSICSNPLLPESFFRRYHSSIHWDYLSKNRGNLIPLYDENPDKLDWEFICQNPSVPMWFYQKYFNRLNWDAIARNTHLPRKIMAVEVHQFLLQLSRN